METRSKRIAIHFRRLGPYHIARINAAAELMRDAGWDVCALEIAGNDTTYRWRQELQRYEWERVTLFPNEDYQRVPSIEVGRAVARGLDQIKPDAVAICGYASPDAWAAQRWCRANGAISILMTETGREDSRRVWWKEWIKSRIARKFNAAICGGELHRSYLMELGFPSHQIHFGYDVVDNDYFAANAQTLRNALEIEILPYFLSSNRFIPRKNLLALINAYHNYLQSMSVNSGEHRPWSLVLLGDGEQRPQLEQRCSALGLRMAASAPWEVDRTVIAADAPCVYFPGFRQIEELPRFYAHAGCFIHPALSEPWGLVLNEAMASSLPILASEETNAARSLIDQGVTGWRFAARDEAAISRLMSTVSGLPSDRRREIGADASRFIHDQYPTRAFGKGLMAALESTHG